MGLAYTVVKISDTKEPSKTIPRLRAMKLRQTDTTTVNLITTKEMEQANTYGLTGKAIQVNGETELKADQESGNQGKGTVIQVLGLMGKWKDRVCICMLLGRDMRDSSGNF